MAQLCRDFDAVDQRIEPVLDRLASSKETAVQYQRDKPVIQQLAESLYTDASKLAYDGDHTFALANQLSADLERLVFGYLEYADPGQIDSATVPRVQEDLAAIDQAMADGALDCASTATTAGSGGPPSGSGFTPRELP